MNKKMYSIAIFDSEINNISLIKILTKKITSRVIFLEKTNPHDSFESIKENSIDLCFISLEFPKVDYMEMVRLLKNKNKQARIIALNSINQNYNKVKNEMGFDSCIEVGPSFVANIRSEVVDFIFYRN